MLTVHGRWGHHAESRRIAGSSWSSGSIRWWCRGGGLDGSCTDVGGLDGLRWIGRSPGISRREWRVGEAIEAVLAEKSNRLRGEGDISEPVVGKAELFSSINGVEDANTPCGGDNTSRRGRGVGDIPRAL